MFKNFGFFEISALSALIPIVFGIVYNGKLSIALKFLLSFIAFSLVTDIINFCASHYKASNSLLINIYAVLQTIFIAGFFFKIPRTNLTYQRIHLINLFCVLVSTVIVLYFTGNNSKFNVLAVCISSVGVVVHCGIYLVDLLNNKIEASLANNPSFYVVSSLFIYHSCVFMIFLTFGLFDYDISQELWNIKLAAYMIFNFFILVAFYVQVNYIDNIES